MEMHRRTALKLAAGGVAGLAAAPLAADEPAKPRSDRDCVLQVGMTPDEADAWELAARLAGKFFALPKLHPTDAQEVAAAIHLIQNKLLSRPTYRRYLELAKSMRSDG